MGVDGGIPSQPRIYSKSTKFTEINSKGWPHNLLIKLLTVTNYKLMWVLIDSIMNLDCIPIKYQALYGALGVGGIKRSGLNVVLSE